MYIGIVGISKYAYSTALMQWNVQCCNLAVMGTNFLF